MEQRPKRGAVQRDHGRDYSRVPHRDHGVVVAGAAGVAAVVAARVPAE